MLGFFLSGILFSLLSTSLFHQYSCLVNCYLSYTRTYAHTRAHRHAPYHIHYFPATLIVPEIIYYVCRTIL